MNKKILFKNKRKKNNENIRIIETKKFQKMKEKLYIFLINYNRIILN